MQDVLAHTLGAFRRCQHDHAILYAAVMEAHGPSIVRAALQAGDRAGTSCTQPDPVHRECVAVLDLLDEHADVVVGDRCIPTEGAFEWWRRAIELRATSSDCEVCEPRAFAAARAGGDRG